MGVWQLIQDEILGMKWLGPEGPRITYGKSGQIFQGLAALSFCARLCYTAGKRKKLH